MLDGTAMGAAKALKAMVSERRAMTIPLNILDIEELERLVRGGRGVLCWKFRKSVGERALIGFATNIYISK